MEDFWVQSQRSDSGLLPRTVRWDGGESQIESGCEMPRSEFWPNQLLLDHIKLNRLQLRTQTGQAAMN